MLETARRSFTSDWLTVDQVAAEGQILPIYLSAQNAGLIQNLASEASVQISTDALTTGIDADSVFYTAIATVVAAASSSSADAALLGIPCFIGNFAYVDGIFSPTWADRTDTDGFIIANGKIAVKEYVFPSSITEEISLTASVSSIIELDANNQLIFGSDVLDFSPFVPGRAEKIGDNRLLLAGLKPGGELGSLSNGNEFNFRVVGGDVETRVAQKAVLQELFFGSDKPFVGAVLVFDTQSLSTTFEYLSAEGVLISDVDLDVNDEFYIVAETSFEKSGRVIKLDSAGNITFSFGEGVFSIINDVFSNVDGSVVVST